MVDWWPSKALVSLKSELDSRWPDRGRAADGFIASVQHHLANPTSDHEQRLDGEVCAFDITCTGIDHVWLAEHLRTLSLGGDRRIKYLIHDRKIYNLSVSPGWRPYDGVDPHTGHIHLSVVPHATAGPWGVTDAPAALPVPSSEDDDMTPDQDARQKRIEGMLLNLLGQEGWSESVQGKGDFAWRGVPLKDGSTDRWTRLDIIRGIQADTNEILKQFGRTGPGRTWAGWPQLASTVNGKRVQLTIVDALAAVKNKLGA